MPSLQNKYPRVLSFSFLLVGGICWYYFVLAEPNRENISELVFLLPIVVLLVFFVSAIIFGRKVPRIVRWTIIFYFLLWSLSIALLGRTEDVGNSYKTVRASVYAYVYLALFLHLALIRLASLSIRNIVILAILPVLIIGLSLVIATAEEDVFKKVYREGVSATARWSVSPSWLSYDPSSGILRGGSD